MTEGARSAEEIRALVKEADPAFLGFMDDCKRRFGARLTALRVGDVDLGWSRWLDVRSPAVTWQSAPRFSGHEEWKRIEKAAVEAGDAARRKPTHSGHRGVA
jgi:hypothetical protein